MFSSNSNYNTVIGFDVGGNLSLTSSNENIYIGDRAGPLDFSGINPGNEFGVICIGSAFSGTAACFINGSANNGPFVNAVTIDPVTGRLGGLLSSARFKKDIEPMGKSSEAIYSLKPVTFHYKNDQYAVVWLVRPIKTSGRQMRHCVGRLCKGQKKGVVFGECRKARNAQKKVKRSKTWQ